MRSSYIVILLAIGLTVFAGAVIGTLIYLPENDQLFAFLTGVAGNFSGALFTFITRSKRSGESKNDDSK